MKYKSVFEIIGPVMVGPSSSHTAGAVRIGRIAREIFGELPKKAEIFFYGSFGETYKGHATDVGIVAGILGFDTSDIRVKHGMEIAAEQGLEVVFEVAEAIPEHPNTVKIILDNGANHISVTGVSVGGGAVSITELNGFRLKLTGEHPSMLILHQDVYGMVASVTGIITRYMMNISHMEVSRQEKGQTALMVIETDEKIREELIEEIKELENIIKVIILDV